MRNRRHLFFLVLAALPALASAQTPAGGEFRVNTYTTDGQFGPSVAADAAGNFVVTWMSYLQDGSFGGIFGQRYSAAGAPQGAEFQVNAYTTNYQYLPSVAMDAKGNFVVVWQSSSQDGSAAVIGQRFSSGGVRLGSEFRVNTYTPNSQGQPVVASDAAGNFVVAWASSGQDGSIGYGIFGQRFNRVGAPLGAEFRVNTYTTGQQQGPSVASAASGGFVVVWQSSGQDGSLEGIFGQRYDSAGSPLGGEFQVNTYTTSYQRLPSVAMARDGSFIVSWGSNLQDGAGEGTFARHYNAAGIPLVAEFQVNTYTTGRQGFSSVSSDANGNFVVSWVTPQDGSFSAMFARRYDSAGGPRGGEFQVNTYTTGYQSGGTVASDAVGNFVVTWGGQSQYGSSAGVFGQRFGGLLPAALALDTTAGGSSDGNRVFEAGETVDVAPSWRNVNGAPQAFTGAASIFTGPGAPTNPTYTIPDTAADYSTVPNDSIGSCTRTSNCYSLALSVPTVRPVSHWDATVREDLLPPAQGQSKTWTLHVGDSFADVTRANPFYRFIETLLHKSVTGGCNATDYCPFDVTTRAQLAVFVLVSKEGTGYLPPTCGVPMFNDVAASSPFCRWIEELARRGVVAGCGGGNYCPLSLVSRDQLAVFVLSTKEGIGYNPAACVPGSEMFGDVVASSPFCRWIEELARRGVVSGCGGGNYCPTSPVTRQQMSVFLAQTFGLLLYEP